MTHHSARTVVIIGASGSIGGAVARLFAAASDNLILSDLVTPTNLESLQVSASSACFIACDLAQSSSITSLFNSIRSTYGHIDILVNAAGIVSKGPSEQLDEDEWDRVTTINLKSVFLCSKNALAMMTPQRSGRIINIGSVIGQNGGNARPWLSPNEQLSSSNVAYAAAKAGVHAMTAFMAREYARFGITVNAIAPGPVATPMIAQYPQALIDLIPMRRLATPEEVADAVFYLASKNAGFINGTTLDVNGGLHIR